jgi:hypothetical protein
MRWNLPRTAVLALTGFSLTSGATAGPPTVTDESVDDAIQRAVAWIQSKKEKSGHWEGSMSSADRYYGGNTGLALLSLLYAGQDARSEEMSRALDWLAAQAMNATYTYGTRAHTLALVPGKKYRTRLEEDLKWLLNEMWTSGEGMGAYGYEARPRDKDGKADASGYWDNSNAQYAVLGVWMATDAGLTAPETYWQTVGDHWLRVQSGDGGWGYRGKEDSTGSMTAAGLATLYVVLDRAYADRPKEATRLLAGIERGLDWFGRQFGPNNPNGNASWKFYYLYGVERVGRASGQKYFRDKDWFRVGAEELLRTQHKDGNWEGTGNDMSELRNTAFALMFLCHGRAPLLFNKLQHGADWNSKLRDVAGLTHYAQRTLERLLNWQIVRLDASLDDLLEAPVLYLCGETAWEFSDVDVQKIREYCDRGGMVLAVAGKDSDAFVKSIEELAQRAYPELPLRPLTSDHPLFSGQVQFPIKDPPPMFEVRNDVRTLMLLCAKDISEAWNRFAARGSSEQSFQLACNIYLYATDKSSIRSRLQTPTIALEPVEIARTLKVARIKHGGRWDIESYGWTRLAAYLNNATRSRLEVTSGITLDSDELLEYPVAYITGTDAFTLTPEEASGLRRFLSRGGTLLADAALGSAEFTSSLEKQLKEVLRDEPKFLPADSFLNSGAGIPGATNLNGVGYRRKARGEAGLQKTPRLKVFDSKRRISVVYSPLDLTVGLLGTQVWDLRGYDPESTLEIMRNMILYANLSTAQKAKLGAQGGE